MAILSRRGFIRTAHAFVVLLMTIPLSHCVKVNIEPVAPKWETSLNLTLVTKEFTFRDLVAKDDAFDTSTATIYYRPTKDAKGQDLGTPASVFNMPSPKGNTIQQEVGVIPVDIGTLPSVSLTATQLGINSANLNPSFPNQTVTFSPAQLGVPTGVTLIAEIPTIPLNQTFGDTSKFSYIVLSNGSISLKITNNFPFAIQFASNQVTLVNYNKPSDSTQVVATFTFSGTIAAGATATSAPSTLAGKTMDGIMKLKGTMSTTGAVGKTLTASNNLTAEVSFASPQIQSMVPDPAPPFTLNQTVGDSTDYKFITFESGTMTVKIVNSFPFDILFASNQIQLVNASDTTQVVGTFVFPGTIAANTTVTSSAVLLANRRMNAIMKMKATVNLSNYFGKTIAGTEKLDAQIAMNGAYLQSASVSTIHFNPANLVAVPDSAVRLDDSIKVKKATFRSGGMKVRVVNGAALKLSVRFKISELSDLSNGGAEYRLPGASADGTVEINPKDSLIATIDMSKIAFVSRERIGSDTSVTQDLHFTLEIKTMKATSGYVTLNKSDQVIADVQPFGSFVLDEVQGKVPPVMQTVNQSFAVPIGDIGDRLSLKGFSSAIKLAVNILSTGLFPTDVDLFVVPLNGAGVKADSVHIQKRIYPGDPSVITIDSAAVNKLMNSFLPSSGELPSQFIVRGTIVISPMALYIDNSTAKVGVGGIKQTDSVHIKMDYAIPVAIGIKDGVLTNPATPLENTLPDTSQLNLIKNGKIYLDVTNSFPLDVELKVKLLKALASNKKLPDSLGAPALTIPQSSTDSVNYPPLRIQADTTAARTGVRSFTFLNLSNDDTKHFPEAAFHAVEVKLKTAGNGAVAKQFNMTDKLKMTVMANITLLIDPDNLSKK